MLRRRRTRFLCTRGGHDYQRFLEPIRAPPPLRTCPEAPARLDAGHAVNRIRGVECKIRVVVAKPGLDGHDRGAKIVARALRDAGMEVIYTGLHQTPEQIVETAIQEDADAVGISLLSGAHMTLVPRILELLRENGAEDVLVVLGGTIPDDDADELKKRGVAAVFGPGAPTSEIVDFLRARFRPKRSSQNDGCSLLKHTRQQAIARKASWISWRRS